MNVLPVVVDLVVVVVVAADVMLDAANFAKNASSVTSLVILHETAPKHLNVAIVAMMSVTFLRIVHNQTTLPVLNATRLVTGRAIVPTLQTTVDRLACHAISATALATFLKIVRILRRLATVVAKVAT